MANDNVRFYNVAVEDRSAGARWIPQPLCGKAFAWLTPAQAFGYDSYDTAGVVDVFEDFGGQMICHRIPVKLVLVGELV